MEEVVGSSPIRSTLWKNAAASLRRSRFSADPPHAAGSRKSWRAPTPSVPRATIADRDGRVLGEDLAELLSVYNQQYPPLDLDGDGFVKGEDLAILLSNWG